MNDNYFRQRQYKNGKFGTIRLPYMDIPDDYTIKSIFGNGIDLSNVYIIDKINNNLLVAGYSEDAIGMRLLEMQYNNFIESAIVLRNAVNLDRKHNNDNKDIMTISFYVIPCAYCIRHSIELYLKYCILMSNLTIDKNNLNNTHKLVNLWNILNPTYIHNYKKLDNFIKEMNTIDENGTILRYITNKQFHKTPNSFEFNIDIMIDNTKYLVNILDEFIIRGHDPIL